MASLFGKYSPTLAYLVVCFLISLPFNYTNFHLLYTEDGIPAGADAAQHTFFILNILETNNPLLSFTAYPTLAENPSSFYPSLMHLMLAFFAQISALDHVLTSDPIYVTEVVKLFMFMVSLGGTVGYAILIRTILEKMIHYKFKQHYQLLSVPKYRVGYFVISALAFSIFVFSISPIIKTYNDGSYPQLTAVWLFLPYYLYALIKTRWIISALLLATIASTHNLSLLMSLSASIPLILSSLAQRMMRITDLMKFVIAFLIFAIPALIFFYLPATTTVMSGEAGETVYSSLPIQVVIQLIKPGLFYAGIISVIAGLVLGYRTFSWISGWVLINFVVFYLSAELGARFARELSLIFGLSIGIITSYGVFMSILAGRKWLKRGKIHSILMSSTKLTFVIVSAGAIISVSYLYFQDRYQSESNPNLVKYYTESIGESNKYFLIESISNGNRTDTTDRGVIVLFGLNPWLRVTTFGKFDVLPVAVNSKGLGPGDRQTSEELERILTSPHLNSTACIIKKYDLDYLYFSDLLRGRFYSPYEKNQYYDQLSLFQSIAPSPFFELRREFAGGEGEHLRVFAVNEKSINNACN